MGASCYRTRHNGALMKASARLAEAREFIAGYESGRPLAENAQKALRERWYGNASAAVCRELTRFFHERFAFHPGHLELLRRYLSAGEGGAFPALNHFYMVLSDPYYRWAAADYLPARWEAGLPDIARSGFEDEAKTVLPKTLGPKSANRYCRNILTALRDNGYLSGLVHKTAVSPPLYLQDLGFMLYSLKDFGEGFNDFDASPLYRAFLKPRDAIAPLFRDGEKRGWWEFTGDRERLTGAFKLGGLSEFVREVGA